MADEELRLLVSMRLEPTGSGHHISFPTVVHAMKGRVMGREDLFTCRLGSLEIFWQLVPFAWSIFGQEINIINSDGWQINWSAKINWQLGSYNGVTAWRQHRNPECQFRHGHTFLVDFPGCWFHLIVLIGVHHVWAFYTRLSYSLLSLIPINANYSGGE